MPHPRHGSNTPFIASPRARPTRERAGHCLARFALPAALAAGLIAALPLRAGAAGTFYVDRGNPACSNSGAGSASVPYCTIAAALAAQGGPSTTIIVRPGTYREQVDIGVSGASGAPLVLRAEGAVIINGADDFSNAGSWSLVSGNVWLAASVTWVPKQVFANGARLTESTAAPASLPSGSFRHVAGAGLYVNVGGGSPALAALEVGRRLYGLRGSTDPWVTMEGFTIVRTDDRGIYFSSGSDHCVIKGNTVTQCFRPGIQASNSIDIRVEGNVSSYNYDHGIATSGLTGSTIVGNEAFGNTKPGATSSGLYLSGSSGNVIAGNRLHDNSSSGYYAQSASSDNLLAQNRSWRNARHGFDDYASIGNRHVGDVAWGNTEEGFAVRGASTGTSLYDCIASENGGRNLLVETTSVTGFASNDNLFFGPGSGVTVRWGNVDHATVAGFSAATGHDTRTIQANPLFVNPTAGDFVLGPGSPAVDNANSSVSGWPALDAAGAARIDDPTVANGGLGPVSYADRGALERVPGHVAGTPPDARLAVAPNSGNAPLAVTADASASVAVDGAIVSYRFDFGDGVVVGPQAAATAAHTFTAGSWTVTVTVTDEDGDQDQATAPVTATNPPPPGGPNGVIDSPPADVSVVTGHQVILLASGSEPGLTYEWDLGGAAVNKAVEDPGPVQLDVAGTFTLTLRVRDAGGTYDPTPATRVIRVANGATLPADEIHFTHLGPTSVAFDWRGAATTIAYGTTPAYGQTATGVTPTPLPYSSAGPFREAKLTGLLPHTLYHYSIGGGPDHTFKTAPPRGTSGFTALVEADIGSSLRYVNVAPVQAMIAAERPDLVFTVGDLTYGNDHGQAVVDRYFNDVMVWSQDAATMPMWGNHEWDSSGDNLKNYKGRFDLPNPKSSPGVPTASCCGEDWFWYDHGNVRFIAYPEPYNGAWANWFPRADSLMDEAQADPQIRFIVTFGHRPAYSSGHHSGSEALAEYLDTLGVHHSKYVLNLNGHSHNYERSHPQSGVTHITAGGGGATLETTGSTSCLWGEGCPPPPWSAFRAFRHGPVRLRFTAGGIVGEALCGPASTSASDPNDVFCDFGTVFDRFVIGTPDQPPVVSVASPVAAAEGAPVSVIVTAIDLDVEPIASLTADLSTLPPGSNAVFTPAPGNGSGTLTWTPGFAHAGSYTITFSATNALAGSATTMIVVANTDRAPVVSAPALTPGLENAALSVAVSASDPDGDAIGALTANLSGLPAGHGAVFTPVAGNASGTLAWTPGFADSGHYTITFSATNALAGSAPATIAVANVDRPPVVVAPVNATGPENAPLAIAVTATDPDGDPIASLTASLAGLPAGHGAQFVAAPGNASGTLTWTPSFDAAPGPYTVGFTATNALSAAATTTVSPTQTDRPPVVTAPATVTATEGLPVQVAVSAADPDGQAITSLTANLSSLPAGHGATFTPAPGNASGVLAWTPGFADSGSFNVTFTAANGPSGSRTTTIRVVNVDRAPVVVAPVNASGPENAPLAIAVTATDPDGDAIASLTASLAGLPAGHGAQFVAAPGNASGTLTWTPSFDAAPGPYTVGFTATNALSAAATTTVSLTQTDRPPVVTAPATVTANEGLPVQVAVTAADADGQAIASLTANLSGLPAGHGAVFIPAPGNASGVLTWTPGFADSGSFNVTFTAANGPSGSRTTTIRVLNSDRAPVLVAPATAAATEASLITITVTASDPDGDAITSLTANLSGLPAGHGATFTPAPGNASGTLTWTPSYTSAPGPYTITFTASNALGASRSTGVSVANRDRRPEVLVAASALAAEGQLLTLVVQALDPDGDALASLTADLSDLPFGHGATFTPAAGNGTGTLRWTPRAGDGDGAPYILTFTVTNAMIGSNATAIFVDRPPVLTAPATVSVLEGMPLVVPVQSADPDGEPLTTLTADLAALPAGHNAAFYATPNAASGTLAWTPTASDGGRSFVVSFRSANALADTVTTMITVIEPDRAPWVAAPGDTSVVVGTAIALAVTAGDPDGNAVTSLVADLDALPSGNAQFAAGPGNLSGLFTWTPAETDTGATFAVVFTAANALAGSDTTRVTVRAANRSPHAVLQIAPNSGVAPFMVTANAAASTDPEGLIASYRFVFGDGVVAGPQSSPVSTHAYAAGTWYTRVVVVDAAGAADSTSIGVMVVPNLIANGSFEESMSGWNVYSSSALARIPGGYHGGWALEMASLSGLAAFGVNDSPDWISRSAVAGTRYRYGAWVRSAAARGKAQLQVREYLNSIQQGVTSKSPLVPLTAEWQSLTVDYVAVTTGSSLNFQVYETPLVAGESFQTDHITLYVVPDGLTGVEPAPVTAFAARVVPNPVRREAALELALPRAGAVTVTIHDLAGRLVRRALDTPHLDAGIHDVPLTGRGVGSLSAGVYFYRVTSPAGSRAGRFVVLQ